VISQVYGGGGNTGATFKNDFIELFNSGNQTVNLTGWSVQYAGSTATTWTNITNLSGSIAPGQYFLIQELAGAGGTTNLPTPDVTGTINMSATAGKVALVNTTAALTGSGCPLGATVVDLIGYGSGTNCSETAAAPAPANSTAELRAANGCTDANNNSTDFTVGAPNPRNTATPTSQCPDTMPAEAALDFGRRWTEVKLTFQAPALISSRFWWL
jgi:predicted extracellular nuclease